MPKKPEIRTPTEREILAEESNLTHSQLAIWTAQQQDPNPGRFARILLFDFEGRLDTAAFQRGFQALVETNDALRMVIDEEDGAPRRLSRASCVPGMAQSERGVSPRAR